MKKIVAFNGSPRKKGNTYFLLNSFLKDVNENECITEMYHVPGLNLEFCKGCLRCNLLGRCSIRGDEWEQLSASILGADILVFGSPVYFHHVTAQLKKLVDRFRSFIHVQLNETGLIHTPHVKWNKDFVLLLSMGSSDDKDADPVIELFRFITQTLGEQNRLHVIKGIRLAVSGQVALSDSELLKLYPKLKLPETLVANDFAKNQQLLEKCCMLGKELSAN